MVFAISGVTAAVAGIFFGIKYTVYPNLGDLATKAFIASVIGGLGSLPGAITGGILLGVLETMVSGYISSTYRDLFAYGFMVVCYCFFQTVSWERLLRINYKKGGSLCYILKAWLLLVV